MWVKLTDRHKKLPIAVNLDNVVHMQEWDGAGDGKYTQLWMNVAQEKSWLFFDVRESLDDILKLTRGDQGA